MNNAPLSLRQMKWISALSSALVIGLVFLVSAPAAVIAVASALGIVVWE